jgi:hypothetical protein
MLSCLEHLQGKLYLHNLDSKRTFRSRFWIRSPALYHLFIKVGSKVKFTKCTYWLNIESKKRNSWVKCRMHRKQLSQPRHLKEFSMTADLDLPSKNNGDTQD